MLKCSWSKQQYIFRKVNVTLLRFCSFQENFILVVVDCNKMLKDIYHVGAEKFLSQTCSLCKKKEKKKTSLCSVIKSNFRKVGRDENISATLYLGTIFWNIYYVKFKLNKILTWDRNIEVWEGGNHFPLFSCGVQLFYLFFLDRNLAREDRELVSFFF